MVGLAALDPPYFSNTLSHHLADHLPADLADGVQ